MAEKKLSEELRHCLEGNGCKDCTCHEQKSVLTCPSLLQKAYERINEYEEMFPCKVGDIVYTNCSMQGWYFKKENRPYAAKVVFIGINDTDNYINVDFRNGHMLQFKFSDIGRNIFLTKQEAETAFKEMEGKK